MTGAASVEEFLVPEGHYISVAIESDLSAEALVVKRAERESRNVRRVGQDFQRGEQPISAERTAHERGNGQVRTDGRGK